MYQNGALQVEFRAILQRIGALQAKIRALCDKNGSLLTRIQAPHYYKKEGVTDMTPSLSIMKVPE
ncbi:hypothetical protein ACULLL_11725 [Lysinibacillus irui]|uniref:hypothetical protein n=1 Tax=Lysinibacillus irui TaxID=2998077 RepID=UPI004044E2B7